MIFGGAFDPFHLGHYRMLEKVVSHLTINTVLLIPNSGVFEKHDPLFPVQNRLEMLEELTPHLPQGKQRVVEYRCIDYELNKPGVAYTIDTLNYLETVYKDDNLYLLIGSDNFFSFHHWKDYRDILKKVTLCVIRRDTEDVSVYKDYVYDQLHQKEFTSMIMIGHKPCNISSTDIRTRLRAGQDVSSLLLDSVSSYIDRHRSLFIS